jgi:hypothetical protein
VGKSNLAIGSGTSLDKAWQVTLMTIKLGYSGCADIPRVGKTVIKVVNG